MKTYGVPYPQITIMCFIRKLFCLFFLTVGSCIYSQDNLTAYLQPQFAINYSVATGYSHNFSLSQRSYVYREEAFELSARQLDIAHFSKWKVRDDQSLAFGIQYRFREVFEETKDNELRLTQQYNHTFKTSAIRYGHRLRSEQRIGPQRTLHRFRYRFAIDFALQGEKIDLGEPYLILSTEGLLSVANTLEPQYDQRFTGNLGVLVSKKTKIQLGLEYRTENYTRKTESVFLLLSSLVLSL